MNTYKEPKWAIALVQLLKWLGLWFISLLMAALFVRFISSFLQPFESSPDACALLALAISIFLMVTVWREVR